MVRFPYLASLDHGLSFLSCYAKVLIVMKNTLRNYFNLVARVDELCAGISTTLQDQITCSEGCSGCCASITIFPVEAVALGEALEALTEEKTARIRRHVAKHAGEDHCPLLSHNRCLLYEARPIICRTHGLPILFSEDGNQRLDCCPLNLVNEESLPGAAIIDLDRLNTVLVAINALFIKETGASTDLPERLTIAEALLGQKQKYTALNP